MKREKDLVVLYIFVIENNRNEQAKCFVHIKNLIVFSIQHPCDFCLFVCMFVCPSQGVVTRDKVVCTSKPDTFQLLIMIIQLKNHLSENKGLTHLSYLLF